MKFSHQENFMKLTITTHESSHNADAVGAGLLIVYQIAVPCSCMQLTLVTDTDCVCVCVCVCEMPGHGPLHTPQVMEQCQLWLPVVVSLTNLCHNDCISNTINTILTISVIIQTNALFIYLTKNAMHFIHGSVCKRPNEPELLL